MLDVIMPTIPANLDLAEESIETILDLTDVPTRILLIIDGGSRTEISKAEALIASPGNLSCSIRVDGGTQLNGCIRKAFGFVESEYVALIPPEVRLADAQWFGKMQSVFLKDPHAFVVDGLPNTSSSTAHPVKRTLHRPAEGTRFALLRSRPALVMGAPRKDMEPVFYWSRRSLEMGGTAWHAPGVRYHVLKSEKHDTWREKSKHRAPAVSQSELPSQTTPPSSTPTTTEKAGPKDFAV